MQHPTLNGTFTGVDMGVYTHYRGIQYGTVGKRFALPKIKSDWHGDGVDCTKWGPRCPQLKYDVGHLLREPEGDIFYDESEDEFKCLNLDITMPTNLDDEQQQSRGLPVLFWVHGGSQIISYGNAASKIGDVSKLAGDSIAQGKPVIIVSIQYRLNIFHLGDGQGVKNLGLRDLLTALHWVGAHIAGFGGDPEDITLAGESAGAALVHAMMVICAGESARDAESRKQGLGRSKFKRAILMSGSLYMSGPQPESRAKAALIDPVLASVQKKGFDSLEGAPVDVLLEAQTEIPIRSVFLQAERDLEEWFTPRSKTFDNVQLLVGDCEFESVLWRNGIEELSAEQIVECFDKAGDSAAELKRLYHINASRTAQARHGALDFVNDKLWALPSAELAADYNKGDRKAYRYVFDQANPWQGSSRAHHAVDLVYLFGGFDLSHNPSAEALGKEMRRRFIEFVHGEEPWTQARIFGFGPTGLCKELDTTEYEARRRTSAMQRLKELPAGDVLAALGCLITGRISLLN